MDVSTLRVRRVDAAKGMEQFIRVPWQLYADDPHWVPPLNLDLQARLSASRNPYFEHAEAAYFIAERDGKTVGRISAQVCQLAQQHHGEGTGHFGFFESEDSRDTARALFATAEEWLKSKGMRRLVGPFNLSINDEMGVLVDGFHRPAFAFMGHHRPYYDGLFVGEGFEKEKDVFAYYANLERPYPRRIERALGEVSRDPRVRVRPMDRGDIRREVRVMSEVFNDAWQGNWGHIPITHAEAEHLERTVRSYLGSDSVLFAEIDGRVVGFIVVLPNLNEFTRDLNGKLFPTGWVRLLWRMQFARCGSVRVPLMGLRREYQRSRCGAAVALKMIDQSRHNWLANGATFCELSWILEDNAPMRRILEALGYVRDKTYRVYSKPLCA